MEVFDIVFLIVALIVLVVLSINEISLRKDLKSKYRINPNGFNVGDIE